MIALDTNVVVRLLTGDDPEQAQRAAELFEKAPVFLPKTVVLECEWVLRYAYGLSAIQVADSFRRLFGLPQVTLEDPASVAEALAWHEQGLDFADALHLASSRSAGSLATFDRDFEKRAKKIAASQVFLV